MAIDGGNFTFTITPRADLSDIKKHIGELESSFKNLKLPNNLGSQLKEQITTFNKVLKEYDKQRTVEVKQPGDLKKLDKFGNELLSSYKDILNTVNEIQGLDTSNFLNFDTGKLKELTSEIEAIKKEFNDLTDVKALEELNNQMQKLGSSTGSKAIKTIAKEAQDAFKEKNFTGLYVAFEKMNDYLGGTGNLSRAFKSLKKGGTDSAQSLAAAFKESFATLGSGDSEVSATIQQLKTKEQELTDEIKNQGSAITENFSHITENANKNTKAIKETNESIQEAGKSTLQLSKNAQTLERQVESYFGLNAIFRTVANMARAAMDTVKTLDKAMTETAVVTDFSVGDMWEKLPIYTAEANKLGSTIEDVYRATTLYYQQGLNTTQSMGLAVETLKMARIAGMDAKDATNAMTAALRGFNLELNQTSAQRINDVYSELAAITASDTQEISSAMEKVASLAHNAGMELETTSAFLAQMIETTREAPENLGTALKTVVARFQEMKQDPTKLVDSEGVMLDANKVDKALKSIGVNLMNANGEFRKLDDVFLEIASKWDTLSMGQQRYIATMAAGSRQQSRFIAMMSNYSRTMELVDAAYDAAGASEKQFEKTLESMDTKLNQLKNAWDQFTMGLMNNEILKTIVDLGTDLVDIINKIINGLSTAIPGNKGLNKSILTLVATFSALGGARTLLSAGITSGFQWFKGEIGLGKAFNNILFSGRNNIQNQFEKAGIESAVTFSNAFQYNIRNLKGSFKDAVAGNFSDIFNNIKIAPSIDMQGAIDTEKLRQNLIQAVNKNGTDEVATASLKVMGKSTLMDYALRNNIDITADSLKKGQAAWVGFAAGSAKAGTALQSFGLILRGTPLAPFGMALQAVGTTLSSVGNLFVQVGENGKVISTGFKALAANIGAVGIAAIALTAAVAAYIWFSKAGERRLQSLSKAAQNASEQLDTLKQNVKEFESALEQIEGYNDAFDKLVPGTDAFNEKLIESNQLILDLVNNFEELRDKVQIDEFGRMFISPEDLSDFNKTLIKRQGLSQGVSLLANQAIDDETFKQKQENQRPLPYSGNPYVYGPGEEPQYSQDYLNYLDRIANATEEWDQEQAAYEVDKNRDITNAIKAALTDVDLKDADMVASLFADEAYETYYNQGKAIYSNKESAVRYYAEQTGQDFNTLWDDEDNRKTYQQQAYYLYALNQIRDSAVATDSALQALNKSASNFIGTEYGDVSDFFTEAFTGSTDANADLIKKLIGNPDDIHKLVQDIYDNGGEDLLKSLFPNGFYGDPDELVDAVTSKLQTNIPLIAEAQSGTYVSVINRLLSSGAAAKIFSDKFGKTVTAAEANTYQDLINGKIGALKQEQLETINTISEVLEQHVGADATSEFMKNAVSIYSDGTATRIQEMEFALNGVDWSSALSRLEAYTTLIGSADEELQRFGKDMLNSADEANILTDAIYDITSADDFSEIYKKREDYVDSLGKFDARGVQKMAEESSQLNRLLDTGRISAYGFAQALNFLDDRGSLNGVTSAVLELISQFDSLGEVMNDAHNIVQNFDPGIDTGEGEDFIKNNYEKVKEYWDNFEYGNEQLINYLKLYAGDERWKALSIQYDGDLKSIEQAILNGDKEHASMSLFAEGFEEAWIKGANEGYSKDGITLGWEDGSIDLDIGDKTTDEVVKWLQEVYGISEEYAKLMLTDFENYSTNLRRDLAKNDWNKALPDFINKKTTANGSVFLTQEEIDIISEARGVDPAKVLQEIQAKSGTGKVGVFDINSYQNESGNGIDYGKAFQGYLDIVAGTFDEAANKFIEGSGKFADYIESTGDSAGDITNILADMQSKGIPLSDSQEMLYSQVLQGINSGETFTYKGETFTDKDVQSLDSFIKKMEEIDQMEQWKAIGEAMVEGFLEGIKKLYGDDIIPPKPDSDDNNGENESNKTHNEHQFTAKINLDEEKFENEWQHTREKVEQEEIQAKVKTNLNGAKGLTDLESASYTIPTDLDITPAEKKNVILNNQIHTQVDKPVGIEDNASTEIAAIDTKASTPVTKPIYAAITGLTAKLKEFFGLAKGQNNYISTAGFYTGSAARGIYGTVGPNGRGGLTLTGEKGFEIAWLPSENRSMIVGATGPQMVDLPKDAVVYTHEQSKKIISQKSIPAGSHSNRAIHGGSGSSSGSGSGSSSSSSSSSDKEKDPKHSNWYKEEVRRFNLNQSINQLTEKIEKITKSISDTLAKLGVKYSDISKDVERQTQLLHQTIAQQQQLRDSYKAELEWLANGNRQLWVSLTNASNESQEVSVGTSQFISGNADTGYSVSYDAIVKYLQSNGYGGENLTANAESLFNLLNQQISNLQSSFNSAAKAIEDAQQKLKDLVTQLKETFYGWENELTKVYDLSKQLELNEAMNGRFTSEIGLLLSSVSTQFEGMADVLGHLNDAQRGSIELTKQRLDLLYAMVQARREEIKALMKGGSVEKDRYEAIKAANEAALGNGQALTADMLAREAAAYDEYARAAWGQLYVTSTQNADGSYTFDFNEEQLEADRLAGKISEDTYNAIKEGFDKLVDGQIDYHEAINEVHNYLQELGEQLDDYYKTMADIENNLIDAFVDAAQREVSKLESLNSSLTNAAKSVLEQVKKSIDARRKAEDNAKTEADIAKKQERLSILRANTGGGNQVEIAQLEKEIGDAQKSYGRTLEDQMLAQIQTQADEASKQRQEQIDLAKQQIEYNKQAGIYAAMADELLDDIKANATQIASLLDETKELGRGKWEQLIDNKEIEKQIIEAGNASVTIPYLEETIHQQQELYSALIQLDKDMMTAMGTTIGQGQNSPNTPGVYNPTNKGIPTTGSTSSSSSKSSSGGSSGSGTTKTNPNAHGKLAGVPAAHQNTFSSAQKKALQQGLNDLKKDKLIGNFGADLVVDGIIGSKTTAAIVQLQKAVGTTQDGIWGPNTGNATHKKFPKYARGGLNKKTGPAWLDGTPTKPELVLNAQDTKNFIALKDILSGVMRSISHTDTSNIYNSPTNFEINVNVDKISSDYDVDKLTERIKRNIVKDATYRNVTAVRNFR